MTVVWSWANLGNNVLQQYNIKQYWLLLSVLSVAKFNPDWKKVFVTDTDTYNFLVNREWDVLWDEIKVIDFSNTEYGNLYNINIYSWPKLYSYGLIDDDMLIMDIDVVFVKPFQIKDLGKISGRTYNHYHHLKWSNTVSGNLRHKWDAIDFVQKYLYDNYYCDNMMNQDSICFHGAPVYVPKKYGKQVQQELLEHVLRVESCYNNITPDETFYAIEEEYPLACIAKKYTGYGFIDIQYYKHGFIFPAQRNIEKGFDAPEKLIGINVFDKYLKQYV